MKLDKGAILSGITVVGTAAAMLSMYGKGAMDALAGMPLMLQAWSSTMPLGVTSFALAMALATLIWLTARRSHWTGPHYNPDTVALCVALLTMTGLQWVYGHRSAADMLTALVLGLIAGLLVPFLCRLIVGKPAEKPPA